jgi:hypothetical protein
MRRRSGEVSAGFSAAGVLFWVFFCLVLCYSFVSPVQLVFVLLKFYWNFSG